MKKYILGFYLFLFSLAGWVVLSKEENPKIIPQKTDENYAVATSPPSFLSAQRQKAYVVRVIDGDTAEIEPSTSSDQESRRRVRYIGIETPETVDPRKSVECFGQEAAKKNRELVEGQTVELEKDVSETDRYGRLLRYIYAGDIFVNDYLIRQGFAYSSSYPPDVKYQEQFRQAEKEARENGRGLWRVCGEEKATPTVGECQIKGNISSKGEKIYHRPNCPSWSKTVISEEKGERWFCSEKVAQVAGWRKARNCP